MTSRVPEHLSPWQQSVREVVDGLSQVAFDRDAWDVEPPGLYVLHETKDPLGIPRQSIGRVAVPDFIWEDAGHPTIALQQVARVVAHAEPLPKPVRGIALVTEVWQLDTPDGVTPEQVQEEAAFVNQRSVEDHPWGVEAKTTFGLDIDGWSYMNSRFRGSGKVAEMVVGPKDGRATGPIPEAMDAVLTAFQVDARGLV